LQKLEHGLVASLTLDCKVEMCDLLLDVGTKDVDIVRIHLRLSLYHTDLVIKYLCCKKLLAALLHEIPLIVRLLVATGSEANTSPRASKRPKISECVPFKNH
jgi:hypothetical protein